MKLLAQSSLLVSKEKKITSSHVCFFFNETLLLLIICFWVSFWVVPPIVDDSNGSCSAGPVCIRRCSEVFTCVISSRHHHHDPARWMLLVPIFQMRRLNLRKMKELSSEASQIARIWILTLSCPLLPPGWIFLNFSNELDQREVL